MPVERRGLGSKSTHAVVRAERLTMSLPTLPKGSETTRGVALQSEEIAQLSYRFSVRQGVSRRRAVGGLPALLAQQCAPWHRRPEVRGLRDPPRQFTLRLVSVSLIGARGGATDPNWRGPRPRNRPTSSKSLKDGRALPWSCFFTGLVYRCTRGARAFATRQSPLSDHQAPHER